MLNVCRQHLATPLVGMDPIVPEEGGVISKKVRIVNKVHITGGAFKVQPGLQTENAAELLNSATECGDWAGDKNRLSSVL